MRKSALKIRELTLQKVPYLLIVGDKEVESRTVAVRTREGADLGAFDGFLRPLAAGRVQLRTQRSEPGYPVGKFCVIGRSVRISTVVGSERQRV